jgi:hypothetical protein
MKSSIVHECIVQMAKDTTIVLLISFISRKFVTCIQHVKLYKSFNDIAMFILHFGQQFRDYCEFYKNQTNKTQN